MDNGQTAQTDDRTGELLQFPQNTQNNQAPWDIQQDRDPRSTGSSVLNSSMAPNTSGENAPGETPMMPPGGNVIQFGQPESSEIGQIIDMEMPPGAERQSPAPTNEINASVEASGTTGVKADESEVSDNIETLVHKLGESPEELGFFYDEAISKRKAA